MFTTRAGEELTSDTKTAVYILIGLIIIFSIHEVLEVNCKNSIVTSRLFLPLVQDKRWRVGPTKETPPAGDSNESP
ncbi:MAG: hypothetical protein CME70_18895 [Halobacteriovorax sp.]|nr:hypothetical protein [Halobacteriovorax sp.]